MTDEQLITEFQAIEDAFNKAVISNSVDEISKYISSDWVLVDAQGGIIPRERFYYLTISPVLRFNKIHYLAKLTWRPQAD